MMHQQNKTKYKPEKAWKGWAQCSNKGMCASHHGVAALCPMWLVPATSTIKCTKNATAQQQAYRTLQTCEMQLN